MTRTMLTRGALAALFILMVVCLHALTGCSQQTPPITGRSTHQVAFTWHIVSQEEMSAMYREGGGVIGGGVPPGSKVRRYDQLNGFTAVAPDGSQHVFTTQPRSVDDQVTLTLGHEVMHVALGAYHPEK